ncbi:MAG: hypothetical protein K0S67_2170 [Nitrososphaeraceae archaeon]|nr:hypothetical protein [Nitrososphaeraceae archaeon]
MSSSTELTDTAYDILKVLGKDADFLYDTIETYIKDAQKANKSDLVEIWQTIKTERKRQMHMLPQICVDNSSQTTGFIHTTNLLHLKESD